jgi:hypothetical protein
LGKPKPYCGASEQPELGREILQVLRASGPASDETLVTEESANSQPESRMREIRESGSEGGARQTNVSFLPLSEFTPIMQAICEVITPMHILVNASLACIH